MNLSSLIVLLVIAVCVVFAARYTFKHKLACKCGGDCCTCGQGCKKE